MKNFYILLSTFLLSLKKSMLSTYIVLKISEISINLRIVIINIRVYIFKSCKFKGENSTELNYM